MLILISDAFDEELPGRLERFGEVTTDPSRVDQAEVVLIRSKTKCTREYLEGAPRLRMIIRGGVGLDNVDLEAAAERGIEVHNTPEASSVAVAEMAFALMLAVPCNLVAAHTSMAARRWEKKALERSELQGKTLGLVGCGRIATELALRAKVFGMEVIGYRSSRKRHDVIEIRKTLAEVLAESDYVSLHTPLTEATRGLMGSENLACMKAGAVLVNTGRGECVDEAAVAEALRSGHLGAYATDVWYSDPPDFDACPLIDAPNVLMAPHIGASTRENLGRIGDIVVEKLEAFTAA